MRRRARFNRRVARASRSKGVRKRPKPAKNRVDRSNTVRVVATADFRQFTDGPRCRGLSGHQKTSTVET